MAKLKHLLNIIKRHTKYPLTNINHEWCEGGDPHYHICYAARLLGSDLPKVCPYCTKEGFEPEHEDVCDLCKYFGIIDITESGFKLNIDSRIVELGKPATWINIASNKAEPYRGWAYYEVPVDRIIEQYAEKSGFAAEPGYWADIDGELLHWGDRSTTIGEYAKDKQEVNIRINFGA